MTDGAEALARRATRCLTPPEPPRHLGLAVSGGGDSMALLWLLAPAARAAGIAVSVASVDHHLRPESRAEALMVGDACARIGVPHQILDWTGWAGQGNLQDAARRARIDLLAGWAATRGIDTLALGHTRDDQAETFLMRLARGSGVDGLSAMAPERRAGGVRWIRPLLSESRETLRDWLRAQGHGWAEDPSNQDRGYARVRARDALTALAPLGIDAEGLSATADRMALARSALDHLAGQVSRAALRLRGGAVEIAAAAFDPAPEETRLRLVAAALGWIGGAEYRPRLASLRAALAEVGQGRRRSLGGVLIAAGGPGLRLSREPRAVQGRVTASDAPWDGRWRLDGPHHPDLTLRALGAKGLQQCPGWRDTGLWRDAMLVSPSIWRGEDLVAAPIAGISAGWRARIVADFPFATVPH